MRYFGWNAAALRFLWLAILASILWTGCRETEEAQEGGEVREESEAAVVGEIVPQGPSGRLAGVEEGALHFAIISDVNASYGSTTYGPYVDKVVERILARRPHLVLSPGDLVAGQKEGLDYAAMWRGFHFTVGDRFFDEGIPFLHAPGNHDASAYSQHAEERVAYAEAWATRVPDVEFVAGSQYPFYYGVRYRGVLIIALDITHMTAFDVFQAEWLEDTLRNEEDARYRLVLGHLPLAPLAYAKLGQVVWGSDLERILTQYKVDMYVSGHHHTYYPGHIGDLRVVSAPCVGSGPRPLIGSNIKPWRGYLWLSISEDGHAELSAWTGGEALDEVDISVFPEQVGRVEREDVGISSYMLKALERGVKGF